MARVYPKGGGLRQIPGLTQAPCVGILTRRPGEATLQWMMTSEVSSGFHPAFVLLALVAIATGLCWWRYSVRRSLQVLSVGTFIGLFWLAGYAGRPEWPVELFLYSDPLLALVHTLAGRVLVPILLVSLVFVVLAVFMGRVFCSHVCPLGALFDVSDRGLARKQKAKRNFGDYRRTRLAKYALLMVIIGSAVAGFNLLGLFDPLVIFTRSSAAVFYPVIMAIGDVGLLALRPLAEWIDWTGLAYTELYLPSFEGALGMIFLLALLMLLGRLQSRFWCRHLCPLGGMLGLCGHWAPYRRRVSMDCNGCDICTRKCPTGAIHRGGRATDRHECIVCRKCESLCPEDAIKFGFGRADAMQDESGPSLGRRGFVGGLVGGLAVGAGMRVDTDHPKGAKERPPWVRPARLIRPPGALPEAEFLARCVRCGECLRACLTNTLQPDWYRAGLEGLWAPHMNLRHAHCEYSCNVCGQVCPTGAIRPLALAEKQHAKVGTAVISRHTCLAWAEDRRCQICDEICPYNAIWVLRDAKHKVGLPVVDTTRCVGCGTCEEKCPVTGEADIVILPQGEFRFSEGSYIAEAKARGFDFKAKRNLNDQMFVEPGPQGQAPDPGVGSGPDDKPALPPGIDLDDSAPDAPALPPGIDLDE